MTIYTQIKSAVEQINSSDFDHLFDEGKEDVVEYLDLDSYKRINTK